MVVMLSALAVGAQASTTLNYPNFGTRVAWNDSDHAARFTVFASSEVWLGRVDAGASGIADDTFYIHFGASSDTSTSTNDVILAGASKGSFAAAGIAFSEALVAFASNIRYLEADGKPGYSIGDFVYFSTDTSIGVVSGTSGFPDIRLVSQSAVTPSVVSISMGDVVSSTSNADFTEASADNGVLPDGTTFTTSPAATFVVKWADFDGNGARDNQDAILISAGNSNERTFLVPGDVYLSSSGGGSFGTRVVSGASKVVPLLSDRSATTYLAGTSADTTTTGRHWFIHFADPDTTNDHILYGDIQVFGSGYTYGTRVTSVSQGLGEVIDASCRVTLQSAVFYIEVDGVTGYSDGDAVYFNRPSAGTCGGTAGSCPTTPLCLTQYDLRASTVPGTSLTTGSLVSSPTTDSDFTNYQTTSANPVGGTSLWFVVHNNLDRADAIALTLLSNGKIRDANSNGDWDTGEGVYTDVDSSGTITAGDVRLFHATCPGVGCSTTTTKQIVAGGDSDASGAPALVAPASGKKQVYVTGGDSSFDASRSEYVYLSVDAFVNRNDACAFADGTCTAGGLVTNTGADVTYVGQSVLAERYFLSWCLTGVSVTCGVGTPPLLLHTYDVEIVSGGTRVSPNSADHVPWLQLLPESTANQRLARWNRGDPGIFDDIYYLTFQSAATTLYSRDLRLVGFDGSNLAGRAIKDSSTEISASVGAVTFSSGTFQSLLKYVDTNGNSWDKNDFLLVDADASSSYNQGDVRLTPTGASAGATTNAAGTIRLTGQSDESFATFTTPSGGGFHVYWFDENRDGTFDPELRANDRAYVLFNSGASEDQAAVLTPLINSIRIVGPGGSSGTGGGGGPPPPPPAAPVPSLSGGTVSPAFGPTGSTFTFTVTYSHPSGFSPTTAQVFFNNSPFDMTTTACTAYTTGCSYSRSLSLGGTGALPYYFQFVQGSSTVRFPSSGTQTVYLGPTENVAPALSAGTVSPASGTASTDFTYTVTYTDANNNAPTVRSVVIDGAPHDLSSADTTYYDGAVYSFTTTLEAGAHSYYFQFGDGTITVYSPGGTQASGPTVTAAATPPPETTLPETTTTTSPGGTPGFEAALLAAAVLGVAWAVRRRE